MVKSSAPAASFLDAYSRRARLQPALISVLPLGIALGGCFPDKFWAWGALFGLLVSVGGSFLLAEIARGEGKARQDRLYISWGGPPTTRALRHRQTVNSVLLERRHGQLQALLPGVELPSAKQELEDPSHADAIYEVCVLVLREKTRDKKQFRLVFVENCSYGFWRNLWAMKTKAVGIVLLSLASLIISLRWRELHNSLAIGLVLDLCLLLFWVFFVNPAWVRLAADAYAESLLASCEELTKIESVKASQPESL